MASSAAQQAQISEVWGFSKHILGDFMIESFSRSDAGSDSQWKISQRQIQELCGGQL